VAAGEADIVGLGGIAFRAGGREPDVSGCRAPIVDAHVRLVRETAGQRIHQVELNVLVQRVIVTGDRREAAKELATGRWATLTPDEILASPYVLVGTVNEMVEDLRARRERWGFSYVMTHEPYMDALAPVVARLAGR